MKRQLCDSAAAFFVSAASGEELPLEMDRSWMKIRACLRRLFWGLWNILGLVIVFHLGYGGVL